MQNMVIFLSNHLILSILGGTILIAIGIVEVLRAKQLNFTINPTQAIQLINHQNAVVIDIRNKDAYRNSHIIDALSFSIEELNNSKKIEKFRAKPIIIVCNIGSESQKSAASLIKHGYKAYSLAGGMRAWSQASMPTVKN